MFGVKSCKDKIKKRGNTHDVRGLETTIESFRLTFTVNGDVINCQVTPSMSNVHGEILSLISLVFKYEGQSF